MTKADKVEIQSLIDGVKNINELHKKSTDSNSEEINKIRNYIADAIDDYNENKKALINIINSNKGIFNHRIVGDIDGSKHRNTVWRNMDVDSYMFNTGSIAFGELNIKVKNISGIRRKLDFFGEKWKDEIIDGNWECYDIDFLHLSDTDKPWYSDLIHGEISNADRSRTKWSREAAFKYNWNIEGWCINKKKADKTRQSTEYMVNNFKKTLNEIIESQKNELNTLSKTSEVSVYVKVTA